MFLNGNRSDLDRLYLNSIFEFVIFGLSQVDGNSHHNVVSSLRISDSVQLVSLISPIGSCFKPVMHILSFNELRSHCNIVGSLTCHTCVVRVDLVGSISPIGWPFTSNTHFGNFVIILNSLLCYYHCHSINFFQLFLGQRIIPFNLIVVISGWLES